jgi:hypothetical protein
MQGFIATLPRAECYRTFANELRLAPLTWLSLLQVVFKALIVLHTMIRNGATDNVLSYLSSSDVLRLKNISAGAHWEGELCHPSCSWTHTKLFPPRL